jgi:phosphoribosylformylglycinamidine synthase PurS subunit
MSDRSTFTALVEVQLRPGIADPQGATIERALPALGVRSVHGLHAGKAFRFDVEADDHAGAVAEAELVADRLLANPVLEEWTVTVTGPVGEERARAAGAAGGTD